MLIAEAVGWAQEGKQSSEFLMSSLKMNVCYECSLLCVSSPGCEIPSSQQWDSAGLSFAKQHQGTGFYWTSGLHGLYFVGVSIAI